MTDCSSIVIAHEKGLFKKYGINSTVAKGASWAAIRDALSNGDIQATHMLTGMPIASTMGLAGSPKKPMIIPWLMNRNGQAITLNLADGPGVFCCSVLFRTPTELKGNAAGDGMPFGVLFARVRDRISSLRSLYGEGPLPIDFRALSERAGMVRTAPVSSYQIRPFSPWVTPPTRQPRLLR